MTAPSEDVEPDEFSKAVNAALDRGKTSVHHPADQPDSLIEKEPPE